MEQAEAFLQAIADDPSADAPRLIFADWLDEQDDEASRARAEFIRVQYALLGLPHGLGARVQLEARQQDLLRVHQGEWTAFLAGMHIAGCEFRRGFVEKIAIPPQALARHGAAICARAPIRELQLLPFAWGIGSGTIASTILALADAKWLDSIHTLDLSRLHLDESSLHHLLQSPRLSRLADLSVSRNVTTCRALTCAPFVAQLRSLSLAAGNHDVNSPAAVELLGSGVLSQLTHLTLSGRAVTARELEAFAAAVPPGLESLALVRMGVGIEGILAHLERVRIPELRRLDLSHNLLDPRSAAILAGSLFLESVEDLDLSHNQLGDAGVRLLAQSSSLGRLRVLNLNSNSLLAEGCRALAAGSLPGLRSLHLRTNRIGDGGLRALVRSQEMAGLTALHASANRITSLGAMELAETFPSQLAVLDLSWNRIGDTGVMALASAAPGYLSVLDLGYCELGDKAAHALARSNTFAQLQALNLDTNRISDAGLAALADSLQLRRLETLNLSNNNIGDRGVHALLASTLLSRLATLHLLGTSISHPQRRQLRLAFRGILGLCP